VLGGFAVATAAAGSVVGESFFAGRFNSQSVAFDFLVVHLLDCGFSVIVVFEFLGGWVGTMKA
jgi:hypothetical protein